MKRLLSRSVRNVLFFSMTLNLYTQEFPTHAKLKEVLKNVVKENNGGFGFNMWATVVDRDGIVRLVTYSGLGRGDQWPGSRVISAQKANTANAFSLPSFAISTANLYSAVQPGGSLYGLLNTNPVDTTVAYRGKAENFGTPNDPMVGGKIGGINSFGGGLALYDKSGKLVGGIGISGDTSCADHIVAWKVRHLLGLDRVPAGVSPTKDDNMVIDVLHNESSSGWGHPECSKDSSDIAKKLPTTHPITK